VLADNGNEFKGPYFHSVIERLKASVTHIHAGRPQTNGHVEALHKTMLQECWRPAFARNGGFSLVYWRRGQRLRAGCQQEMSTSASIKSAEAKDRATGRHRR